MKRLKLKNNARTHSIVIDYDFLDYHMPRANGEFVKVYLLLLKHLTAPSGTLSITKIADSLEMTEKDVMRALKYWEKEGLIEYSDAAAKTAPPVAPAAPVVPINGNGVTDIQLFRTKESKKELKQLFFIAEQYLGKTLSPAEAETIAFIREELKLSTDVIDYLIEYCVENGHKHLSYIKKVAITWSEEGIDTVDAAKSQVVTHQKKCYAICRVFGINGRSLAAVESDYVKRWSEEYNFPLDIIIEACNRTIATTHNPSFEYADKILGNWFASGVKTKDDINELDNNFKAGKAAKRASGNKANKNNFNNFDERDYDMDELARKLIQ
ncbi:DnaD/phage-associated family protein [Lachnospiraceae bacterium PF1-21]|uniref:DnaD domain protein n=1 Tax=Ohessyouella blattaphilus TaxID=2949333 RepID=A0ABT1EJF8_9FIRM|nr:DnaD domain protein [Ohessyouella blattaphilus]MCP1110844.1 DnaD domain protein [Ohessyouella blattaphilus]MCR8564238.1 DnaD domain protein [Ohessyouella blattaphilus]MDL2250190.1 DnaD domain protein [Lachnospiraceae bacterium OttesenSCG-928-J05]